VRFHRRSGSGSLRSSLGGAYLKGVPGRLPIVVGESKFGSTYKSRECYIKKFSRQNRLEPTKSETRFEIIIRSLGDGILRDKYKSQHPISGKWIVDFFFPDIRLAVEIDGSIHFTATQIQKDRRKDADCRNLDITVLRISNKEVWGDQEKLITKLRQAWRDAKRRDNRIIGKAYIGP
jgi:very-short-patch-repair endonuclease